MRILITLTNVYIPSLCLLYTLRLNTYVLKVYVICFQSDYTEKTVYRTVSSNLKFLMGICHLQYIL